MNYDPYSSPVVWIVVSRDKSSCSTILAVLGYEEAAKDFVKALDDADTDAAYEYEIVKRPILR